MKNYPNKMLKPHDEGCACPGCFSKKNPKIITKKSKKLSNKK